MMWWYDDGPAHWMYYGPLFMVLFFGICMTAMFFMMRAHFGGRRAATTQPRF